MPPKADPLTDLQEQRVAYVIHGIIALPEVRAALGAKGLAAFIQNPEDFPALLDLLVATKPTVSREYWIAQIKALKKHITAAYKNSKDSFVTGEKSPEEQFAGEALSLKEPILLKHVAHKNKAAVTTYFGDASSDHFKKCSDIAKECSPDFTGLTAKAKLEWMVKALISDKIVKLVIDTAKALDLRDVAPAAANTAPVTANAAAARAGKKSGTGASATSTTGSHALALEKEMRKVMRGTGSALVRKIQNKFRQQQKYQDIYKFVVDKVPAAAVEIARRAKQRLKEQGSWQDEPSDESNEKEFIHALVATEKGREAYTDWMNRKEPDRKNTDCRSWLFKENYVLFLETAARVHASQQGPGQRVQPDAAPSSGGASIFTRVALVAESILLAKGDKILEAFGDPEAMKPIFQEFGKALGGVMTNFEPTVAAKFSNDSHTLFESIMQQFIGNWKLGIFVATESGTQHVLACAHQTCKDTGSRHAALSSQLSDGYVPDMLGSAAASYIITALVLVELQLKAAGSSSSVLVNFINPFPKRQSPAMQDRENCQEAFKKADQLPFAIIVMIAVGTVLDERAEGNFDFATRDQVGNVDKFCEDVDFWIEFYSTFLTGSFRTGSARKFAKKLLEGSRSASFSDDKDASSGQEELSNMTLFHQLKEICGELNYNEVMTNASVRGEVKEMIFLHEKRLLTSNARGGKAKKTSKAKEKVKVDLLDGNSTPRYTRSQRRQYAKKQAKKAQAGFHKGGAPAAHTSDGIKAVHAQKGKHAQNRNKNRRAGGASP